MIRLENVSKRYQMGKFTVTALDHVSLNVDTGEFVVVLGPSGSGKTTLLNLISALDTATEGTLEINGARLVGGQDYVITANSRQGLAEGALYAARWIAGKKGLYNFADVLSHEVK